MQSSINRKVIALASGMAAGAVIGILLSSFGKHTWTKKFNALLSSGDNIKRKFSYRLNSVLEKKRILENDTYDLFEDYLA